MKKIILIFFILFPFASNAQEYYTFESDTSQGYNYIEPDSFFRNGVFDDEINTNFSTPIKPKTYFEVSKSATLAGRKMGLIFDEVLNRNDERMELYFFSLATNKRIVSRLGQENSHVAFEIDTINNEIVMKVELRNVTYNISDAMDSLNMQVWVFENGMIEYRYGPSSIKDFDDAFGTNQKGPFVEFTCFGDYDENPNNVDYVVYFQLYQNPERPRVLTSLAMATLHGLPKSGTVYRFTPQIFYTDVNDKFLRVRLETYPNPAAEKIYFHNKHLTYPLNVTITNIAGQRQTLVLNQGENEISLAQKGVLIIELQDAAGRKYSQKVVSK
ncbi:MAG: hypothetical protein ACI9WO_002144 [Sphingobacteriales bacterium]|jgi:hypothetical protein